MDFGCITIDPTLKLYLFGTPGQDRFGFMWDDLVEGALGGAGHRRHPAAGRLLRRRSTTSSTSGSRSRSRSTPSTAGSTHDLDEVRWALDVGDEVPVIAFDARERGSVRDALLVVLELALARAVAAA